jgi:hypothetical protein
MIPAIIAGYRLKKFSKIFPDTILPFHWFAGTECCQIDMWIKKQRDDEKYRFSFG